MQKVNRRRALQLGSGGLAAAGLTLAGCGGGSSKSATTTPGAGAGSPGTQPSTQATPKSGGTFKLGTQGFNWPSFDDATLFVTTPMVASSWVGESLLRFAIPDTKKGVYFNVEPALAAALPEESPDHLTVTFKLKAANWHNIAPVNGRALKAADVKASLERAATPKPQFIRRDWYSPIDSISTPDDQTVVLKMKEPYAGLNHILSNAFTSIVPTELAEKPDLMNASLIGTGPYMFKDFTNGRSLTLVRNPDFREKGHPLMDSVTYTWFGDAQSLQNAFTTSNLDQTVIDPTLVDAYRKQNTSKQYIEMPFRGHYFTCFNTRKAPFNDARVRQAFQLLTDRQAMLTSLASGYGWLGTPMTLWNTPWALPENSVSPRNVAEAKKLLEAAGASNLKVTATVSPFVLGPQQATLLKQNVKDAGIDLEIENVELNTWTQRVKVQRDFQMYTFSDYVPEEPDEYLPGAVGTGGSNNDAGYSNPQVDDLLKKQRHSFDHDERKGFVDQIQKILIQDAPNIYNFDSKEFWALGKGIQDFYPSPSAGADARRSAPNVWAGS